mgnify:CR=1 FL=1
MAQRRVEKGISQRIQGGTIMNSSDVKKIASFDDIIEQHQLSRDALKALEKRLSQQANMDEFQFTSLQKEAFNKEGFWRGDPKTDSQHVIVQGATSSGKTLVSESTLMADFADFQGTKTEAAKKVGELIAKKAQDAGITAVVFDRGGNKYHGRVAAVAEGAREGGLAL